MKRKLMPLYILMAFILIFNAFPIYGAETITAAARTIVVESV